MMLMEMYYFTMPFNKIKVNYQFGSILIKIVYSFMEILIHLLSRDFIYIYFNKKKSMQNLKLRILILFVFTQFTYFLFINLKTN